MGHGPLSLRCVRHLLFFFVERHFDFRKGGLVYRSVSLRRPVDPAGQGNHPARISGGDQVLSLS